MYKIPVLRGLDKIIVNFSYHIDSTINRNTLVHVHTLNPWTCELLPRCF